MRRPRLSLGPVQYLWPRKQLLDFYGAVEDLPVDIVYLGETVCSKRRPLNYEDWIAIAEKLHDAGKEVVLSTLALVEAGSELGYIRKLCGNGEFAVEANDMSAVQMLAGEVPFIGGASLNIYNDRTLARLATLGMRRWVMPVELSADTLDGFERRMPDGVETELFAWGRLPLAYSARCYTARARNVTRDACEFCCESYPDGLLLETRDDEPFLVINGIQTQSARVHCLADKLAAIGDADVFRISPQAEHTERVVALYADVLGGDLDGHEAARELAALAPGELCDGYWHGTAGMSACDRESLR
jgi:collagenase-like PrtC family protease